MNQCVSAISQRMPRVLRALSLNRQLSSASEFTWKVPSPVAIDTGIQIYNCVARTNVPLVFPNKQLVTWYTCGPTVYDSAHVGHASCYVRMDIIQRILRDQFNVNLVTAMNITDIDDKIINRSWAVEQPWQQLAKHYETEFWQDCDALGIQRPDIVLRVTERIPEIVQFVEALLKRNDAYIGRDGSVYFSNKLTSGKLQNIGKVDDVSAEQSTEFVRRTKIDFVLWKVAKPDEPSWPVPWSSDGAGRPGWHTECSAMASHLYGRTIDIHGGGMDLRFPHHENEENQSCVFHDTPQWVNYWIHVGQLQCDDAEKMSKSLKNTVSIAMMLQKFTSNQFRMACLLSNYHSCMSYNEASMSTACSVLRRLNTFIDDSTAYVGASSQAGRIDRNGILAKIQETCEKIDRTIKSNFTTSRSVEHLLDLITFANKSMNSRSIDVAADAAAGCDALLAARNLVIKQMQIFGIEMKGAAIAKSDQGLSDKLVDDVVALRESVRNEALANKDNQLFRICNDLRQVLVKNNIELKDLPKDADGVSKTRWTRQDPIKIKINIPTPKREKKK